MKVTRYYLVLVFLIIVIVTFSVHHTYASTVADLDYGIMIENADTTGHGTTNLFPFYLALVILIILIFVAGCKFISYYHKRQGVMNID